MVVTSTICPLLKLGLQIFGVWPDVPFGVGRQLIYLLATALVQYFQYQYVFAAYKRGELQDFTYHLPAAVYYSLTAFKVMTVWKYRRIIYELLAAMDTDWREYMKVDQYLRIMITKANISKFCTYFLMGFNFLSSIIYFGGNNLVTWWKMLQGYNVTSRPFPVMVLLPFDAEQSPVYELIVLFLYLHSMAIIYMVNLLSSFVLSLVFHATGQFEIMCQQLKAISEEIPYSSGYITKMLIQKHNKVILFSENIDKLFSFIALVQVFGNTMVICFEGLVLMISSALSVFSLLQFFFAYFGITIEIFIFCFIGEHISSKSKSLGDAGYESLWYNMSPTQSKNILFIIMRSQKQLTITVGGMANLSLEAFTSIMKASASYMSILNALY